MKPGDIGPLMRALLEHLEDARIRSEQTTTRELAAAVGHPLRNVQRAVERLRLRKSQIANLIKDGRSLNGTVKGRKIVRRIRPTPLTIVEAAMQTRSLLECAWRNSGMGELA